jgi:ATP-dependent Clp protease ATP-binding subunit ClpX
MNKILAENTGKPRDRHPPTPSATTSCPPRRPKEYGLIDKVIYQALSARKRGGFSMGVAKRKTTAFLLSFCGKHEEQVERIIAGPERVYLQRVRRSCACILLDDGPDASEPETVLDQPDSLPAPHEIKAILDEYVIGQDDAKKILSVAVYNHYKRIKYRPGKDDVELQKSNILLIGPTGSGKTLLAQTLARILKVPFAIADATTLTEAGYVGEDVENILVRLVQAADYDLEAAASRASSTSTRSTRSPASPTARPSPATCPARACSRRCSRSSRARWPTSRPRAAASIRSRNSSASTPRTSCSSAAAPSTASKRLPVIAPLKSLTKEDLIRILTEPKNALVKQYTKLLDYDDVELSFEPAALEEVADLAIKRNIGARGLRAVMEGVLTKVMYDIPSDPTIEKVVITKDCITGKGQPEIVRSGDKKARRAKLKAGRKEEGKVSSGPQPA